ncbi:MAG: ATP-dependent dethiobiotin synthetase BioD, partial [Sandaracinaceae bacterium]
MTRPLFISGTDTGVGKTFVTRGLTLALRRRGYRVRAIKPVETGCDPAPQGAAGQGRAGRAHARGRAAGRPREAA